MWTLFLQIMVENNFYALEDVFAFFCCPRFTNILILLDRIL